MFNLTEVRMAWARSLDDLWKKIPKGVWLEILIRVKLFITFITTEHMSPFIRVIQPEEFWLYKFPTTSKSIVSSQTLSVSNIVSRILPPWVIICSGLAVILINYGVQRNAQRCISALCVLTLALPLTGIVTNIIKISVGRPRPDFLNRCYGSNYLNIMNLNTPCSGDPVRVLDGRKSFPSGHSSLSFCVFGFVFLCLAAQLETFNANGRSKTWRLLLTLHPLILAALIAISRTCDYHHHWQDVAVGSILGFGIVYIVYRQYFPSITSEYCQTPYPIFNNVNGNLEMVSS